MNKVLMISNTASMQYQFLLPWILQLRDMGCEVHIACNFKDGNNCSEQRIAAFQAHLRELGIPYFQVDFHRNALKLHKHPKPLRQLEEILRADSYALIHCHSPIGGALGRIAGKRMGIKVLYTAHGFHFFKGAPPLNWMLFYPVERMLSRWTDTLVTINKEDYSRAQRFHAAHTYQIPGAGVELECFRHPARSRAEVLQEFDIPENAVVFISIGELNKNKNHAVLLRALKRLRNPNLRLLIVGKDNMNGRLERLAGRFGIAEQVHFAGFRTDIADLLHASDVFCFPSRREGLGFTAIEAMAAGLPLITSDRHGILDYSVDGITGFTCHPEDDRAFADAMRTLAEDSVLRKTMGRHNAAAASAFDIAPVLAQMRDIYAGLLPGVSVPDTNPLNSNR